MSNISSCTVESQSQPTGGSSHLLVESQLKVSDGSLNGDQIDDSSQNPQLHSKKMARLKVSSIEDIVPGGKVQIRDIIDRKVGDCIGIKRMTYQGLTGYPEKIATHIYISFRHFFELHNVLEDMMKSVPTKKWIKFVKCHYERDMYQRSHIHKDLYSKDCSTCRNYVEKLTDKAIWWFSVGPHKYIRMSFKNFCSDVRFECCIMWIRIFGTMEVELELENASEGQYIRRSFRVQTNDIKLTHRNSTLQSPIDDCSGLDFEEAQMNESSATAVSDDDHTPFCSSK